jgi:glycosyltransferase involved in cell wall biosynthesis
MKITMLGHKRFPSREGGIEVVVTELATRMVKLGHTVICLNRHGHHVAGKEYDDRRKRLGAAGVWIHDVWTLDRAGLAAMTSSVSGAFRAALSGSEVVHFHAEGPCAMLWLPKLFGKRCVVTIHGLDHQRAKWGRFARWYIMCGERMAAKRADEIIVLSKPVQEYFRKTYGRETRLIPNGVSAPVPRAAGEITRRWGLSAGAYILFLARMVPEKGIRRLIEAFKEVRTDKRLVLAGGPSGSEAFYREMQGLAAGDPRILFTGFVQGDPLEELFSNAYLFVLPSDLEGMPLALLEAMAYGNACLVSDIPECTDVAGDAALVFRRGVSGDLRDKLQAACDRPETLEPLRAAAAGRVRRRFDWDDIVRRTLLAYEGKPDVPPAES